MAMARSTHLKTLYEKIDYSMQNRTKPEFVSTHVLHDALQYLFNLQFKTDQDKFEEITHHMCLADFAHGVFAMDKQWGAVWSTVKNMSGPYIQDREHLAVVGIGMIDFFLAKSNALQRAPLQQPVPESLGERSNDDIKQDPVKPGSPHDSLESGEIVEPAALDEGEKDAVPKGWSQHPIPTEADIDELINESARRASLEAQAALQASASVADSGSWVTCKSDDGGSWVTSDFGDSDTDWVTVTANTPSPRDAENT